LAQVKNVVRVIYPSQATVFQNRALITARVLYVGQGESITVEAIK
jgi:hypothetical protein